MQSMYKDLDDKLVSNLKYRASLIVSDKDILPEILAAAEKRKHKNNGHFGINKYAAVILAAFITLGGVIAVFPSTGARAVDAVKTVFVMDKNSNIIEKKDYEAYLNPSVGKRTSLSDEELSKKIGVAFNFPQNLADYKLDSKCDFIGLKKQVDYATYDKLSMVMSNAISDEEAFKSLEKYDPSRNVGAYYKNSAGNTACMSISNYIEQLPDEILDLTEKAQQISINGQNVSWIALDFPNYDGANMTKKPDGRIKEHILYWNANNATYVVEPLQGEQLNYEDAIKIAQDFIAAQPK